MENKARPFYLTHLITQSVSPKNNIDNTNEDEYDDNDEWEDIDDVAEVEADMKTKLDISD